MFVRFFSIIILLCIGVFGSTYQADSLKGLATKGRGIALVNNKIILKDSVFIENSIPSTLDSIYGKTGNSNKIKIAKLPDSVRVAEKWDGQIKPADGTNGQVLKTDGVGNWFFADEGSVIAGFIQSINGSNETAQTILGDNGLQVVDSGTGNPVHKIRPVSGKIIPSGTGDTVSFSDSSLGSASLGGYPASYHDSVGHGTLQSQIFALSDSVVKKALKHHGVTVGRVPYANTDSSYSASNMRDTVDTIILDGNLRISKVTSSTVVKIENTGDNSPELNLSGNRSASRLTLGDINFRWLGNIVARIRALSGSDPTNKDDGSIAIFVSNNSSTLDTAIIINQDKNIRFKRNITSDSNITATANLYSAGNSISVQSQLDSKQDTSWKTTGETFGIMYNYAGLGSNMARATYFKYNDAFGDVIYSGNIFKLQAFNSNLARLEHYGYYGSDRKWSWINSGSKLQLRFTDSLHADYPNPWFTDTLGVEFKKDTTIFRGKIITSENPTDIQTQLDSIKSHEYRTMAIKHRMLIKFNKPIASYPNSKAFILTILGTILDTASGTNGSEGSYAVYQKMAIRHNNSAQPRADVIEANSYAYTNVRLGNTPDGNFCIYLDTTYRGGYYGTGSIDYHRTNLFLNIEGDSSIIASVIDSTYPATTSEIGPPASEQSLQFQTYTQEGIGGTVPVIGSNNYAGIKQLTSSGIQKDSIVLRTELFPNDGSYAPTSVAFTFGSGSGNIASLKEVGDSIYTIVEATGSGYFTKFSYTVDVENKFKSVNIICCYVGSASHFVNVYLRDTLNSRWDCYNFIEHKSAFDTLQASRSLYNYSFNVDNPNKYVANDGKVILLIAHAGTGISSHRLYLDQLTLGKN